MLALRVMGKGSQDGVERAPSGEDKRTSERLGFRLADSLEVRYKFLSRLDGFTCSEVFRGTIVNLSKGGALFEGAVPGLEWLPKLGEGQVLIGLNVMCPGGRPVKALTSLRWARAGSATGRYELGVQFEQLEPEHRASLDRFLLGHQVNARRTRPEA